LEKSEIQRKEENVNEISPMKKKRNCENGIIDYFQIRNMNEENEFGM
jgi:hypothetical protein